MQVLLVNPSGLSRIADQISLPDLLIDFYRIGTKFQVLILAVRPVSVVNPNESSSASGCSFIPDIAYHTALGRIDRRTGFAVYIDALMVQAASWYVSSAKVRRKFPQSCT